MPGQHTAPCASAAACLPGKAQQLCALVHPLAAWQGHVHPARAPLAGPREASRSGIRHIARLGGAAAGAGCHRHVVEVEGAFAAQVTGEGEPPAKDGADAVAAAGEEADVDEQPAEPAERAAELDLADGDDGATAGNVGGGARNYCRPAT